MRQREFQRGFRGARQGPAGFSLVEVLVVISIITLLIALLMPALSAMRESARNVTCTNNLRQIGVGLSTHAQTAGRYCSGAFDWRRDGCVTEVGWVADLVEQGMLPGELLCPSNPAKLAETYNDLLTLDPTIDQCVDREGSDDRTLPDGTVVLNPCKQLAAQAPGPARRQIIEDLIYLKGFNTNYVATWFLVRGDIRTDANGNLRATTMPACPAGLDRLVSTSGGLLPALLGGGAGVTTSTQVPLLADAQPVDITSGLLGDRIGPVNPAEPLAEGFTDGPVLKTSMIAPTFANPTPFEGMTGWWARWNNDTLQDYRDFAPVHGGDACNVLFADGGVRPFVDLSGDGFLNNGFDPAAYTGSTKPGFQDDQLELTPDRVYSGWSLIPGRKDKP